MKKYTAAFCALAMIMGLAGCAKQSAPAQASPEPEATAEAVTEQETPKEANDAEPAALLGGWTLNSEYNSYLTDEETEVFSKAMEGLTGVGYQPVDILATQVVAGTNYAYLCMSTTVTAEPRSFWSVIVIYEDLEGNATLSKIEEIDLSDIKTADEAPESGLAGGWTIREAGGKPVMMPDPDAEEAVESVMHATEGLTLKPSALLGTQLVSGMNYKVLMRGESESGTELYVTTIYRNLEGKSEITENKLFDLLYYVTID